jgi:general secretion pathway protein J
METPWNKGFTLLEVLVGLALLSLLAAALYGTYFSLMRARETATTGMALRRELRTSLDMVRREIASAFFNRRNERLLFVVEDRDSFGKPASTLALTTLSLSRGEPNPGSDLLEVRYGLREKGGKMVLTRQAKDVYLITKALPYPQMEGLESFLLECFDGGKWVRSWDTALNDALPRAVRVTIRIKEGDKTEEFFAVSSPKVTGR